jgi:NAD(P)-dependent dehydrogenase (short-subunit alcohol dehydrogenase family)
VSPPGSDYGVAVGRLGSRVAFITGAGSGIARATALLFATEGARVVIAEVDEDSGQATETAVTQAGGEALFVPTDVTQSASVKGAIDAAIERFGALHIIFNCAGGSSPDDGSVVDTDPEVWRRTLELNLLGPMLCCRHGMPQLIGAGGGSIINVSSVTALRGGLAGDMYSATKGAIISLTRSLAARGAEHGVRANAIAPGTVLTPRVAGRMGMTPDDTVWSPPLIEFAARHPFSVGKPADVASIALFLATDESRLITGALIPAEGGITAY